MCSGVRGMCSGVQMSLNFYKEVKEKTKTKEIVKKIILICKSEIYVWPCEDFGNSQIYLY